MEKMKEFFWVILFCLTWISGITLSIVSVKILGLSFSFFVVVLIISIAESWVLLFCIRRASKY